MDLIVGARVPEPRCQCCDLIGPLCGRQRMKEIRADDPLFADWLETPEGARL
ncbi:hypothetical protein [Plantactinospora sp. WMMB782]|uniref:hypothetical protein n=1 Tax=Plantactinospora sp. WMMB782 TaxID=3404121 RepID=UPI003B9654DA